MKEKLKNYMNYLGLTAAQLADQIGVQRSSFSHVLNGRNKPSADFINKLLLANPDLNANWFFGSSENMLLTQRTKNVEKDLFSDLNPNKSFKENKTAVVKTEKNESFIAPVEKATPTPEIMQVKQIEKIVIFYSDKSFKDYKPE